MLRDQVRRAKKMNVPASSHASTRLRASKPRTTKRSQTVSARPLPNTFFIIIAIALLLIGSLWYGFGRILSYATLARTPRMTLLLTSAVPESTPTIWLLAEGRSMTPRYFAIATDSELTSGLSGGILWSKVAQQLSEAQTPALGRTVVSQALGIPITNIVYLDGSESDSWSSVVGSLRSSALQAVREGSFFSDPRLNIWLVARQGEGEPTPQPIATIITKLARQSHSAISSSQNCSVAVLNNSGKPGFASLVGRIIEQNGGTVLRVANALSVGESDIFATKETQILVHPGAAPGCAETISAVQTLVNQPTVGENETLTDQYRASVVLVLGPTVLAQ